MTRKFVVTIKEIENEDSVAKKTLAREAFMNLIREKDSLDGDRDVGGNYHRRWKR